MCERQTDRNIDRKIDREIYREIYRKTDRKINTDRHKKTKELAKREGVVPVWLDLPKYVHLFQGPRTFVRSRIKERRVDGQKERKTERTKWKCSPATIFKDHLKSKRAT